MKIEDCEDDMDRFLLSVHDGLSEEHGCLDHLDMLDCPGNCQTWNALRTVYSAGEAAGMATVERVRRDVARLQDDIMLRDQDRVRLREANEELQRRLRGADHARINTLRDAIQRAACKASFVTCAPNLEHAKLLGFEAETILDNALKEPA